MNAFRSPHRKIDPTRGALLGDGTPNDNDRLEIGPTLLEMREWEKAGLKLPNLAKMRQYRLERLVEHIVERDYGGLLLTDPLNIRYATDTTNMQLWNTHNPFRTVLICADGYMVIWDYKNSPFLADYNPLVRESRAGTPLFYFSAGDAGDEIAKNFVSEVDDLIREHSGGNHRIAVDKIMLHGLRALESAGFDIRDGEEVSEKSRSVKGPDEILAMRCANHSCESAIAKMEELAVPGLSENEIWSVLHQENIRQGGEWIETRLLTTGPRTNPWFQESGPRVLQDNEILAFDTDLIGCYGICIDISRTWWVGSRPPRSDMVYAMRHAVDHIADNTALLEPGVSFTDLTFRGHVLDDKYQKLKYGVKMHGVGLCDEWPAIAYPDRFMEGAFDYEVETGMVFCVEALVGEEGGDFSIKLEDQVLVTDTGHEIITTYPLDKRLMGESP